ncbi:retinoid-inducible serine carboxypeptidase-like [Diabrotica undecimpunctata]|uniref:retinoid-inducible serine carboxypeptidase-like n=1 Tax=Diabrotica undecimpunctata TaxID=50387 RepID=UPI003B63EDE2
MLRYLIFALMVQISLGKRGFGPNDQDWGYVSVRKDSHMFWWLYYTTADVVKPTDKPLIIWLQGGPGVSSTGMGNFGEIGPLTTDLKNRSTTWVQWVNLMFVDNPSGCGFSYVENGDYPKNNTEIAIDFVALLKGFYDQLPEFKDVPLYIFSESYGGKMTAEIALFIYKAQERGELPSTLKGIGLGDAWVSPVDSIMTYAPYLLNVAIIDQEGHDKVMAVAKQLQDAVNREEWTIARNLWGPIIEEVDIQSFSVDIYNILTKQEDSQVTREKKLRDELDDLMNNEVKPALNLTRDWSEDGKVMIALTNDFMKSVTHIVEEVLNTTDIKVAVYNGQLDLIVDILGTMKWVKDINFKGKQKWENAPRTGFSVGGFYEGYVKKAGNFGFYWVDRAGHMVPADNPSAMYYILRDVTNDFEV